jgi:hypothetical protein
LFQSTDERSTSARNVGEVRDKRRVANKKVY